MWGLFETVAQSTLTYTLTKKIVNQLHGISIDAILLVFYIYKHLDVNPTIKPLLIPLKRLLVQKSLDVIIYYHIFS